MNYPIDFVTKSPTTESLRISNRQSVTQSLATYAMQVVQTSAVWMLQFQWARMSYATAETVNAWLASLQGQVGTFKYYPRQSVKSAVTGISLAQAGYNYNTSIVATGFGAGASSNLRVGQYFTLGNQLLMITTVGTTADGNGNVTINFQPNLRTNYAAGSGLNFLKPFGVFRLTASEGIGMGIDVDRRPEFSQISAMEVA